MRDRGSTGVGRGPRVWLALSLACGLGVGLDLWPYSSYLARSSHRDLLVWIGPAVFAALLCLGALGWRRSSSGSWPRSAAGELGALAAGLAAGAMTFTRAPWQPAHVGWLLVWLVVAASLWRGVRRATLARALLRAVAAGAAGMVGFVLLLTGLAAVRWLVDGPSHGFRPGAQLVVRGAVGLAVLALVRRPAGLSRPDALALLGAGVAAFALVGLTVGQAARLDLVLTRPGPAAWQALNGLWSQTVAVQGLIVVLGLGIAGLSTSASRRVLRPA